jgi:hypothetical protein
VCVQTSPSNATMHLSRQLHPPSGVFHRCRWWRIDRCLAPFMMARYALLGASLLMADSRFVGSRLRARTQAVYLAPMPVQLGVASAVVVAQANLDSVVPQTDLLLAKILMADRLAASKISPGASLASDSMSNFRL